MNKEEIVRYLSLMDSTSALSKGQCFSAMDTRHLHSFSVLLSCIEKGTTIYSRQCLPLKLCGHDYQQMCHYNMLVAAREMKQEQYQELLQKALHSYGSLFQAFCQLLSATMSSTCVFMLMLDSIYVILQHEHTNSSSLVFISDISKHISSITNV